MYPNVYEIIILNIKKHLTSYVKHDNRLHGCTNIIPK